MKKKVKVAVLDSGMQSLSYNPEYHGGYTAEYGGNNDVNYIACYELYFYKFAFN